MIKGLEHLKSKRYWALILLGPPLRIIFASAVVAGLHLGLGLPWPTLEDAGIVARMLEMLGLMGFLMVVDGLVVGRIYGVNFFTRGWSRRKLDGGMIGMVVTQLTMLAGYIAVLAAPFPALHAAVDFNNSPLPWAAIMLTTMTFPDFVREGERQHRGRVNGAAEEASR